VTTIAWLLGPELIDRRRLGEGTSQRSEWSTRAGITARCG